MRIRSLSITNFRAIRFMQLDGLTDFVLIAGPNGCGKSCVFDAIRLLKSVYGGYQANEWMQWFGEFQIDLNDREQLSHMFKNPAQPLAVAATVQLSDEEKEYLRAAKLWTHTITPPPRSPRSSASTVTSWRNRSANVRRHFAHPWQIRSILLLFALSRDTPSKFSLTLRWRWFFKRTTRHIWGSLTTTALPETISGRPLVVLISMLATWTRSGVSNLFTTGRRSTRT